MSSDENGTATRIHPLGASDASPTGNVFVQCYDEQKGRNDVPTVTPFGGRHAVTQRSVYGLRRAGAGHRGLSGAAGQNVVPFAPAGPTDTMARLIAQKLSDSLGKQFYVENHPGAGGNLGMAMVANAAPDGYTLLLVSSSVVVNPSLYEKVPYDVYKSLAPITLAGSSPNILVVHPSVPAKDVKELIAYVQANPGKVSFASPGFGTTASLAAESFKYALKLDIQPVPFNGAGPRSTRSSAGRCRSVSWRCHR